MVPKEVCTFVISDIPHHHFVHQMVIGHWEQLRPLFRCHSFYVLTNCVLIDFKSSPVRTAPPGSCNPLILATSFACQTLAIIGASRAISSCTILSRVVRSSFPCH